MSSKPTGNESAEYRGCGEFSSDLAPARSTFIAFDVETTGLIPGVDRVVEIAAVAFRGEETLDTYEQLVDPGMPIPQEAQRINGITDGMVRGKPPLSEALPDFFRLLEKGFAVAHNAVFDASFLCAEIDDEMPRSTAAGVRVDAPDSPILDTRNLARRAFPGLQSYSLDNLVRDIGLENGRGSAHRALADAHACRALFASCVRRLSAGRPLSVADLLTMSGPPLSLRSNVPIRTLNALGLRKALRDGELLEIEYVNAGGRRTVRRIRPLQFGLVGGSPAVIAHCLLRNQDRTFLLDSIREIRAVK